MDFFGKIDQPGPGVYVDEQREGPLIRFFRTLALRFFLICLLNFIFVAVNIPFFVLIYFLACTVLPFISPQFSSAGILDLVNRLGIDGEKESVFELASTVHTFYVLLGAFLIVGLLLIVNGPLQTGFSYVYRNFARQKPSFFWQDFAQSIKNNVKQSLLASLISLFATLVILFNIFFYAAHLEDRLSQIMLGVFSIIFLFLCCIQLHIYPLIATLDLSLKQLYKNAMILSILHLLPTFGILLLQSLLLLVIPGFLILIGSEFGSTVAIVFYLVLAFGLSQFLGVFYVWHQIEKHMFSEPMDELGETDEKKEEAQLKNPQPEDASLEGRLQGE